MDQDLERAIAPSAPAADQLRSRLLSPRQVGGQLRPSTHSHTSRSRQKQDAEVDRFNTMTDSFSAVDWNISNFEVVKSDTLFPSPEQSTALAGASIRTMSASLENPLLAKRILLRNQTFTQKQSHSKVHAVGDNIKRPVKSKKIMPSKLHSVEDWFDYFNGDPQILGTEIEFVHITPRYNVETVLKPNFYDLCVLGIPGIRDTVQKVGPTSRLKSQITSSSVNIMQLSRNGLLINDPRDSSQSMIVPLQQFHQEKVLFDELRKKRFFLYFKEAKVMTAWHLWARHCRITRVRAKLLERTYFSHSELVATLGKVQSAMCQLETDVELFAFHGTGTICISDYLELQIKAIQETELMLIDKLQRIAATVSDQFEVVLSGNEHKQYVDAVIRGHPYAVAAEVGVEIDWVNLRTVQRIEEDCKQKLENILCRAQYMLEATMARMMGKFWRRCCVFVRGIRSISRRFRLTGYWDSVVASGQRMDRPRLQVASVVDSSNNPIATPASPVNRRRGGQRLDVDIKPIVLATTTTAGSSVDHSVPELSFLVDKDWLEEGSHLCVNVTLCLKDRTNIPTQNEFLLPENIRLLKIRLLPSKTDMIEQVHNVYGALGQLLENLPSLRRHPIVSKTRFKPVVVNPDLNESVEDGNYTSKGYFTRMHVNPLFDCDGALAAASEFLRLAMLAHGHAGHVEIRLQRLEEAIRKLCSLNPEGLVKQLNYSLLLPKIVRILETPDSVDDVHRAILRDRGRLTALQKIVSHLETSTLLQRYFLDIKHHTGFVTSFQLVTEQLSKFCEIQRKRLFGLLPNAFMIRTKQFTDYLHELDAFLDLQETDLDGLIVLLKKLKSFDAATASLELEFEICESMYRIIENQQGSDGSQDSSRVTTLMVNGKSPDALFKQYLEAKESMLATATRGKSLLLGMLSQIKKDVLELKGELHSKIRGQLDLILDPRYVDASQSPVVMVNELTSREVAIRGLHGKVMEIVDTQEVLTNAHDIVGAANVILGVHEIDKFPDMTEVLALLEYRLKGWKALNNFFKLSAMLVNNKLGKCNIKQVTSQVSVLKETGDWLLCNQQESKSVADLLVTKLNHLQPKLELLTFLSSKCLRPRHFRRLCSAVFEGCGYLFKFSGVKLDVMTVVDTRSKDSSMNVGSIGALQVSDLLNRGVALHVDTIRNITAEAAMESMIEVTLARIEDTIASAVVATSADWLRDTKLREKIFFELCQAINLTQLSVLVQFCLKSALLLEQISLNMNLSYFNARIDSVREVLQRVDRFIENIREVQYKWFYVFHHVKFTGISELDRDSAKSFQVCTEELKRIELVVQQKSGNLLLSCISMTEYENNIESSKQSLTSIMEDAHSNIQSLLDGAPRLSLISYHRLHQLVSCWMIGGQNHLNIVSECFHDMFEGVGTLLTSVNLTLRSHFCLGFVSFDSAETILFESTIDFNQSLPKFVKQFEFALRKVMIRTSDDIVLCRIQSLRSLLINVKLPFLVSNINSIFQQRIEGLLHVCVNEYPNQCMLLINHVSFAEDIWTCLGHPTGSLCFARTDLDANRDYFVDNWRPSLEAMISVCKYNLKMLQDAMRTAKYPPKIKCKKAQALFTSLFIQEVGFLRSVEFLLSCRSLETACEVWAGKYQIKYLYNKDMRTRDCPYDIMLGCVTVPYGLEYQGANVSIMADDALEGALQKVISSAFCSMATVLVSHDDNYAPTEASGEYSISSKDIAFALGRICFTLLSVQNASSVRLFLSRLTYLDAVGCIDFTTIDHAGLQLLVSVLTSFWKALSSKQDVYIQESLKFPLKTKFGVTETQMIRRKENLIELREGINFMTKHHKYAGILLIALASETHYSDSSVFDYFSRSVFNAISVSHSRPIEKLGLYLSVEGYMYGFEVQDVMIKTIIKLKEKYSKFVNLASYLSSSQMLFGLVSEAGKVLAMRHERLHITKLGIERFKLELDCFGTMFWEYIMLLGDELGSDIDNLRDDAMSCFQELYADITRESQTTASFVVNTSRHSKMLVPKTISDIVRKAAKEKGLWMGDSFTEQCASLWNVITNPVNSVVIMSGPSGCGKSSLLETVFDMIKRVGIYPDLARSSIGPIKTWRAAFAIARVLTRWYRSPAFRNWKSNNKKKAKPNTFVETAPETEDDEKVSTHEAINPIQQFTVPKLLHKAVNAFSAPIVEKNTVHVSVIYHTSMTSTHLLGGFDAQGRWNDGILLRKFRQVELKRDTDSVEFHIIILDGPLGYYSEQVFGSAHCLRSTNHNSIKASSMVFPSGEICRFSENLRVVFEANDVSHASPAFLVCHPHFHCVVDPFVCCNRVLKVWIRSLSHWLGNFPPWRETVDELRNLFCRSDYVTDLLFFDSLAVITSPCVILSKVGSFLRILEELLCQCHALAVAESTFAEQEMSESDSGSSDESDEDNALQPDNGIYLKYKAAAGKDLSKLTMMLGDKGRERLRDRTRLSLVYASIWGLGGGLSSDKSRKSFDTVIREKVFSYFQSDVVEFPKEVSVYGLIINLQAISLVPANPVVGVPLELPQRFSSLRIGANIVDGMLRVTSPGMVAIAEALNYILQAGGNPLLIGQSCSGKSSLVENLLRNLGSNLQSAQQVQQYIRDHLVDIIGERTDPEGEALIMLILRETLKQLSKSQVAYDSRNSFVQGWSKIQEYSQLNTSHDARVHCHNRTVMSSKVSLRTHSSAESLRGWFDREYASEVKYCLETPRFNYGLVFVDDLHIAQSTVTDDSSRRCENRPEALLKGLLSSTPLFGIKRNYSMRLPSAGFTGMTNGEMNRSILERPVLHRSELTDPREASGGQDDYIMQPMGFVACATVTYEALTQPHALNHVLKHFSMICLPSMNFNELHAGLIFGAYISLGITASEQNVVSSLRGELIELCNITLAVCKRMVSSVDAVLTTSLEKSIRTVVNLDINLISRFCGSLQLGSRNIHNAGSLLQLFVHEWKRYFLDPFPVGSQRERFVLLFREEIESVDIKKWCISTEWLVDLINDLAQLNDSVWSDTSILSATNAESNLITKAYVPISFSSSNCRSLSDTLGNNTVDLDCKSIYSPTDSFACTLFPAAIAMVLRIVRIVSRNCNVLVASFHGSTARKGIQLAAMLCRRVNCSYESKDGDSIYDSQPGKFTANSLNFKRFLRTAVLSAAGFKNAKGDVDEFVFNAFFQTNTTSYVRSSPRQVLLTILNAQQLNSENRQLLLNLINVDTATQLFEDYEIIGMAECLRMELHLAARQDSTSENAADHDSLQAEQVSRIALPVTKTTTRVQAEVVHTNSHFRGRHSLTGYAFHWVKKHLKESMRNNLIFALECSLSKVNKIVFDVARGDEKQPEKASITTTSTAPNANANANPPLPAKDSKRRFSLLSKSGDIKIPVGESSAASDQTESSMFRNEFFCCPILGPSLRQNFNLFWWEIDCYAAANGLCSAIINADQGFEYFENTEMVFSLKTNSTGDFTEHAETDQERQAREFRNQKEPNYSRKQLTQTPRQLQEFKFRMTNFHPRNLSKFLGIYDQLGIFRSRNFEVNYSIEDQENAFITRKLSDKSVAALKLEQGHFIAALKDEVGILLPYLLVVPTACDAVLLSEPVLTPSPEGMATMATEIALNLIHQAAETIFIRRYHLNLVAGGLNEVETALFAVASRRDEVVAKNAEVLSAIRMCSSNVINLKIKIGNIKHEFLLNEESEIAAMIQEDYLSRLRSIDEIESTVHDSLLQTRGILHDFSQIEWYGLAAMFASKPPKEFIDVMRVVMAVINFTPPEPTTKKKSKTVAKSESDIIARCSISLLRSQDFGNQLISFNPISCNPNQMQALTQLFHEHLEMVHADAVAAQETSPHVSSVSAHPIIRAMKNYLFTLRDCYYRLERVTVDKMLAIKTSEYRQQQVQANEISLTCMIEELHKQIRVQTEHIRKMDAELARSKRNLEVLHWVFDHQDDLRGLLRIHLQLVDDELTAIDEILINFAADAALAAVTFARGSWLPEELRQEAILALRTELSKNTQNFTDSPFVCCFISDNLQIRKWTPSGKDSIPRDFSSINCMTLASLSPHHTYIVDPDGSAEHALLDANPDGFQLYSICGLKFSMALLESWASAATSHHESLTIIITDVQAGASDDLIAFLSADVAVTDIVSSVDGTVIQKLQLICNPQDENHDHGTVSISVSRMRIYLTSTCAPIMEANGSSYPLPVCCFKNMAVVHWISMSSSNCVIDSNAGSRLSSRTSSMTDNAHRIKFTHLLEHRLCHQGGAMLQILNSTYIRSATSVADLMAREFYQISCWVTEERDLLLQPFAITDVVEQPALALGFLCVESIWRQMLQTEKARYLLLLDMQTTQAVERENLAYQSALAEVFSMSIDFLRVASYFLDSSCLPPSALAPRTLATKCIHPAIANGSKMNIFYGIPDSMSALKRVLNAAKAMQATTRWRKCNKSTPLKSEPAVPILRRESSKRLQILATEAAQAQLAAKQLEIAADKLTASSLTTQEKATPSANYVHHSINFPNFLKGERKKYLASLHFLLFPLRNYFLKETVAYLSRVICPGHEWKVKLSLVIALWSKTQGMPADEIRALKALLESNSGTRCSYYSFVAAIYGDVGCSEDVMRSQRVSTLLKSRATILSSTTTQSASATISDSTSAGCIEDLYAAENTEQHLAKERLGRRVSAFRVGIAPKSPSQRNFLPRSGMFSNVRHTNVIDGLYFQRSDRNWRIGNDKVDMGFKVNSNSDVNGNLLSRQTVLFTDSKKEILTRKNVMAKTSSRPKGDAFLMEWLQLSGARLFSVEGLKAASALGASESVMLAIFNAISFGRALAISAKKRLLGALRPGESRQSMRRSSKKLSVLTPNRGTMASVTNASPVGRGSFSAAKSSPGSRTTTLTLNTPRFSRLSIKSSSSPQSLPGKSQSGESAQPLERRGSLSIQQGSVAVEAAAGTLATLNSMLRGLGSQRSTFFGIPDQVLANDKTRDSMAQTSASRIGLAKAIDENSCLKLLFSHPKSRFNFELLENHSTLSKVFKGFKESITADRVDDFIEWRQNVTKFGAHEFAAMSDVDLEEAALRFTPPNFVDEAEEDELSNDHTNILKGVWLQGFELTILQTMILSESMNPGSAAAIANAWFGLLLGYLQRGGKIIENVDEMPDDDDEYFSGNASSRATTGFAIAEEDENEDELEDRFDFHKAVQEAQSDDREAQLQAEACLTNCWTRLRRIITGESISRGSVLIDSSASVYRLTCRDFENWEAVLLEVLQENNAADKFTYMSALRASFQAEGCIFLSEPTASSQMTILSQRARNLGIHNDALMPVVNCNVGYVAEIQKQVRTAAGSSRIHKAIIEMLNLSSINGNAVLQIGLNMAGFGKSAGFPTEDSLPSATLKTREFEASNRGQKQLKNFPFIVSSIWNGNEPGRGPWLSIGELSFVWLPRYLPPDMVGLASSNALHGRGPEALPGILESGGIMFEELERCLLWVMISCRRMTQANISPAILHQLRHANKIQVRTMSSLLAIWNLVNYYKCAQKEECGMPGSWSESIVPLSLWQLARLLMKTSDILSSNWQEYFDSGNGSCDIVSIRNSQKMKQAVMTLIESFGFVNDATLQPTLLLPEKSPIPTKKGPTAVGNTTGNASNRTKPAMTPSRPAAPMSSSAAKGRPSISSSAASMSIILNRMKKKAAAVAAKSIDSRLEQMRSVNRFSSIYINIPPNISGAVPVIGVNAAPSAPSMQQQVEAEATYYKRLMSCIGSYLSEIIFRLHVDAIINEADEKQSYLLSEPFAKSPDRSEYQGRMSMKLDIKNNFASTPNSNESSGGTTSMTIDGFGLRLGSLNADELTQCLVRWTLLDAQTRELNTKKQKRKARISKLIIEAMLAASDTKSNANK